MTSTSNSVKNRPDRVILARLRLQSDFIKSVIPLAAALLMQCIILLSGSVKGLKSLPFMGVGVIIVMDVFAVVLRLTTKQKYNPVIAYAPPTLLCFGLCIQSTACAVGNYADTALEMSGNVNNMYKGLLFFFVSFFLFGFFAWMMENVRFARWLVLIVMIAIPLLTLLFGTKQNDAKTALFNIHLYQFILIGFVFLASSSFQLIGTPGRRSVFFIVYLAVLSVLFTMMREFGTLIVLWAASIVAILTDIDFSRIGTFSAGGFVFLKNICSVPAGYVRSVFDRIADKINPNISKKSRRKIKSAVLYTLLTIIAAVAVIALIIHFDGICTRMADLYHRKIEMRIYPWLDIGSNVDHHQEALSKSFANAGLFGNKVVHCIFPPHFEEDCTLAMVFQLFGWVTGILFLGIYFAFLFFAHTVCSRSAHKLFSGLSDIPLIGMFSEAGKFTLTGNPVNTARYALTASILLGTQALIPMGSAVKLFPIIGINTPMLSGGGAQYVVLFTLLGIIMSESYTAATDTLPALSDQKETLTFRQRISKISLGKPAVIALMTVVSIVLIGGMGLVVTFIRFNSYVKEKADIMNRIDYHYTSFESYQVPKEVEDIPVAEDPDIHNVLIIGLDNASAGQKSKANARSDSMILISLNRKTKTIKVFSFQRDTFLRFANGKSNKLNAAYKFGGMQLLTDTIKMNYRLPISTTCCIDRSSFKKIIDALNGIDLQLSAVEADYLNKRPKSCGIKKEYSLLMPGRNHLDGWQTLEFVRMRHSSNLDNDYNRAERQQEAIAAMIAKFKKLAKSLNIEGLKKAIDAIAEEVDTNISGEEVSDLLPDVAISLLNVMGADGKPNIERYHVPSRYYSDSYYEYGAWRLKPELRRTAKLLRMQIYGKESLKGIK